MPVRTPINLTEIDSPEIGPRSPKSIEWKARKLAKTVKAYFYKAQLKGRK